ncbi:MAG: ammonia-forming cytochrome c nitrite reductase subunit c552, partial [Actinobacteria bacterium]
WTIRSCAACHEGEAVTYTYDDNKQVGPFGGSIRVPPQPKVKTFPKYNTIVAGHAFAKDYNEEGAHAYMLEDHYATKRGKFETCMQCKSTKVALAFRDGKALTVPKSTPITLTHTASGTVPPKTVVIPAGTKITYRTDPKTRFVDAKATFPDGTVWTSQPKPSDDTTKNYNMVWASTVAATKDTWPYGAGCNHCHDPHTGKARLVRQALLQAIEGTGGPAGTGGVNPYSKSSVKDPSQASEQDQRILSCAQCHVEYVCGKSGVDKKDRDMFGWSKAKDLHDVYMKTFAYSQDWVQAIIGQPLIKSQHPETELYWDSIHYQAGASCSDCHMPEVKSGNETFRSHWFTSPYKYENAATYAAFTAATGLDPAFKDKPCVRCHEDRMDRAIVQQKTFYAAQQRVENKLAISVGLLGAIPPDQRSGSTYEDALTAHRKAHVLWE